MLIYPPKTGKVMGQEKPAEARVERVRVLTPPLLAAVIVLTVVGAIVNMFVRSLTPRYGMGWFIGAFYIVLIFQLLGRLSPKLRLNPGQMLILLIPLWYAAGKAFLITGAGGENWFEHLNQVWPYVIRALRDPTFRTWTWDITPSLIAPKDPVELEKVWRGLMPGEVINWAPWIAPLAFWSLWWIVTTLMIYILVYTVIGPQTVEVERLVYPMSVPATVLLSNAGAWVESGGKARSKLFDLADTRIKVFWISFVLGALFLSLLPMLSEVYPVLPFGSGIWGEISLPLHAWFNTAAVLPGAMFGTVFILHQAILMTLLPYDVLVTSVLAWLIFWVIYPVLGVRLGFLPYSPGIEGGPGYYGYRAPIPWRAVGTYMALGLGLYTLWQARGAIRAVLRGEMAGAELPAKQLLYLFAGLFVVWLALWTAAGGHPLVMIFLFILFVLWQISVVRTYAEIWWHPNVAHETYYLFTWPFGAMVGAWSWAPSQRNQALYIANMALHVHGRWDTYRQCPWNMGFTAHTYKWARDLNVSLRDVLLTLVTVAVIGFPTAFIFGVWLEYHCGFVKLSQGGNTGPISDALNQGVRALTYNATLLAMPFWYHGLLAALSIVAVFAIGFLRTRFAWFLVNPTALVMSFYLPQYLWSAALAALAAKYIGIRVFGARRYEEYVAYVAAGLCWGLGAGYIIAGVYDLYINVIPRFQAFFVP
jgi:hypothetical protein